MSIKEPFMLPQNVFEMQPFNELIDAEDAVLQAVEDIILAMIAEADLAKNMTLTLQTLKNLILAFYQMDFFQIHEFPEENRIVLEFPYNYKKIIENKVKQKLMPYLPAHLKVDFVYRMATWGSLENMTWDEVFGMGLTWDSICYLRGDDLTDFNK